MLSLGPALYAYKRYAYKKHVKHFSTTFFNRQSKANSTYSFPFRVHYLVRKRLLKFP